MLTFNYYFKTNIISTDGFIKLIDNNNVNF